MDLSTALPIFVITLREGVEAALVVGIVLACLYKAQKRELDQWVYLGVAAGAGGSVLIGWGLSWVLQQTQQLNPQLEPVIEPLLETGLCGTAIALLSWMLIWMTQQAKSLKREIEGSVQATLMQDPSAAGWGIFTLIVIAVLREGFETVLFIFANRQQGTAVAVGAFTGLTGAVGLGFALFKFGMHIDLRRFFQVMGILLLLIVAGLVIATLRHLDAAVYSLNQLQLSVSPFCFSTQSCILGPLAWDLSTFLPDNRFPGVILKALLGYRDHLYWVQVFGYTLFLSTLGRLYFHSLQESAPAGDPSRVSRSSR